MVWGYNVQPHHETSDHVSELGASMEPVPVFLVPSFLMIVVI